MNQTPDTTTVTAPAAVRIIGRNLGSIAEQIRDIEPDEMNRADLLSLLRVVASGLDLSGALLDSLADRLNAEAAERAANAVTTRWIAEDRAASIVTGIEHDGRQS